MKCQKCFKNREFTSVKEVEKTKNKKTHNQVVMLSIQKESTSKVYKLYQHTVTNIKGLL